MDWQYIRRNLHESANKITEIQCFWSSTKLSFSIHLVDSPPIYSQPPVSTQCHILNTVHHYTELYIHFVVIRNQAWFKFELHVL
jgi:hypothetical protein